MRFGQPDRFWGLRHSLSEGLRAVGEVVGFDLSLHRSEVMPFRWVAIAQLAAIFPEYEVCDFGHIADGGVHFNMVRHDGADYDPARVETLRSLMLDLAVRDFGASFNGEHSIGHANQAAYDRFTPALVQHYSAAIAAVYFARIPAAAVRFGAADS